MKIITDNGQDFYVHDDGLRVYDELPPNCYKVVFTKRGWILNKIDRPTTSEMIFGDLHKKVDKIESAYKSVNRNFGVILAGDKGLGKTLTVKLLCDRFSDYPVILVNEYVAGIADFISSIKADCVVIFDEFDKTFDLKYTGDDNIQVNPQEELLTLFDGLDDGHKLFIVTCNDIFDLNKYYLNRPGRFHYAIQMRYPVAEDVRRYLKANVGEKYHGEIDSVIEFSRRVPLNYDALRAIAFELNRGGKFVDFISDLNIIKSDRQDFTLNAEFSNGKIARRNWIIPNFAANQTKTYSLTRHDDNVVAVTFNTDAINFDGQRYNIDIRRVKFDFEDKYKDWQVRALYFVGNEQQNFHFAV